MTSSSSDHIVVHIAAALIAWLGRMVRGWDLWSVCVGDCLQQVDRLYKCIARCC